MSAAQRLDRTGPQDCEPEWPDDNVWFDNVERVVSERIGRETVSYVSNIYKYYLAYRLISEEKERRAKARQALAKAPAPAAG